MGQVSSALCDGTKDNTDLCAAFSDAYYYKIGLDSLFNSCILDLIDRSLLCEAVLLLY